MMNYVALPSWPLILFFVFLIVADTIYCADETDDDAFVKQRHQKGERSLTGRLAFDNDLSRLRHGAIAQHSFVVPLLQPGSVITGTTAMEHWDPFLSTVISDTYVRLTPLDSSREGVIWNNVPIGSYSWIVHLGFRVHGGGSSLGGDGFALWYQRAGSAENLQRRGGAAHGMDPALMHEGIGIVFDTFDNDGSGDNPGVSVVKTQSIPRRSSSSNNIADAPKLIDPSTDYRDSRIGSCYRPYRNTEQPEHVIIKYNYRKQQLIVSFADQHCVVADSVKLLPLGFFGLSAHTGAVFDIHDIHYFILISNDDEEDEHADQQAAGSAGGRPVAADDVAVSADEEVAHGAGGQLEERRHPVNGRKIVPHGGKVKYDRDVDERERKKWSGYVEPSLDQ